VRAFTVAWQKYKSKRALYSGRELGQTSSRENSRDNVQ